MKHEFETKVYYGDTDSYGVVWHGAYVKWFEISRVELSEMAGVSFEMLEQMQVQMPVVELSIRYKSPAKAMDELVVQSEIEQLKKTSIVFSHKIINKQTQKTIVTAKSTIVATSVDGVLYRRLPEYLVQKYQEFASSKVEETV